MSEDNNGTEQLSGKVKEAAGKVKTAIDRLPFNGMARKVPSLAKFAGFANYAACALAVLILTGVSFAGCGGGSSGGKAGAETKAAEAAIKKEFGVTGEELIIASAVAAGVSENEIAEAMSEFALMGDSEKAQRMDELRAIFAAVDKKDLAELTGKAKAVSKKLEKDIAEKQAALEKLYKEATSKESLAKVDNLYWMKTEVTQGLYKVVTGTNPSMYKGNDQRPVEQVSWYDAVAFCNKLSERQGLKPCYSVNGSTNAGRWGTGGKDYRDYDVEVDTSANGWRLPTEAEWLAAADDGHTYSGSDNIDDVAWYGMGLDEHPQKVGTKAANANGLYDMSGNVREWCWDKDGSYRVLRGGSFLNSAEECAVSGRYRHDPGYRYFLNGRGFRAVRSAQ